MYYVTRLEAQVKSRERERDQWDSIDFRPLIKVMCVRFNPENRWWYLPFRLFMQFLHDIFRLCKTTAAWESSTLRTRKVNVSLCKFFKMCSHWHPHVQIINEKSNFCWSQLTHKIKPSPKISLAFTKLCKWYLSHSIVEKVHMQIRFTMQLLKISKRLKIRSFSRKMKNFKQPCALKF